MDKAPHLFPQVVVDVYSSLLTLVTLHFVLETGLFDRRPEERSEVDRETAEMTRREVPLHASGFDTTDVHDCGETTRGSQLEHQYRKGSNIGSKENVRMSTSRLSL
jgi:hypothetical protein